MSATTSPNPYQPGDRVRVLVDAPHETELKKGDIVTVVRQYARRVASETFEDVLQVSTPAGVRLLHPEDVEPFTGTYQPAQPDEIVDAAFRALVEADEDLTAILRDADTALGAEEEQVSERLQGTPRHKNELDHYENFEEPGPGNHRVVSDYNGDALNVRYLEYRCPQHGRESAFFFDVNDGTSVVVPAAELGPFLAWLIDRARFAQRKD